MLALTAAWVLLLLRVDPVPTWFYVFAWYPTLTLLDGIAGRLDGRPSLFSEPARALSIFGWSPIIWLAFEAVNLRLENWYYVFLPRLPAERWAGIMLSFATVMPAIVLSERVLAAAGLFRRRPARPVTVGPADLTGSIILGLTGLVLSLVWPRLFFPLIWGVGLCLCEPVAYRHAPGMSLFKDLERGAWGRPLRILAGGMGIGLLWESYNHWAEGSWIYTVPGLEQLKLFEMPPLGFLGFPIFALSGWSMYAALCAAGVAHPVAGDTRLRRGRTLTAGGLALAFTAVVLLGMERLVVSSTVPRLEDLPGVDSGTRATIASQGILTPRELASRDPDTLARTAGLDRAHALHAVRAARLVMLRGLGARHAATLHRMGIESPCQLLELDADTISARLRTLEGRHRPTPAEVRVWQRAAERTCGSPASPSPN